MQQVSNLDVNISFLTPRLVPYTLAHAASLHRHQQNIKNIKQTHCVRANRHLIQTKFKPNLKEANSAAAHIRRGSIPQIRGYGMIDLNSISPALLRLWLPKPHNSQT